MGFTDFTGVLADRSVRRTWLSQIVSLVGDMTAWVGANVLVFQQTHSSFDVALLNALTFAAWLGPAQVLTAACARFPRLRVMVATDVIRAVLFCSLVVPGLPLPAFLALYFAAMCNAPVFECTRSALMMDITRPEELAPALSLLNSTSQAGSLLGFAFGGALVAFIAPQALLVVNAGTFVVSALLLAGVRIQVPSVVATVSTAAAGGRASLRAATRSLRERVVLRCVVLVVLMCLATSAGESIIVVFANSQLHTVGAGWVGVLAAAGPAGALVGIGLMRHRQSDARLMRSSLFTCLWCALATAVLAPAARWMPLAILLYGVLGTMAMIMGPTSALVTPRLPVEGRAAAWSVLRGLVRLGEIVGALAAGVLATRLTPGLAIAICAAPVALVAAFLLLRPLPGLQGAPAPRGGGREAVQPLV
jgi:predicted MFS family arabinose efflux permease